MNQRTHSWIAIRAIALLADENKEKNLVKLLLPHARKATVGAWIPDQVDAKRGGSKTENHVLKMLPFSGPLRDRFVADKEELLKRIGQRRMTAKFLRKDSSLNDQWWNRPYKGHIPKKGQHLANRAMGLSVMIADLLLMGNKEVDRLIPGSVRFVKYLDSEARTEEEAAAMYLFMLSHFMADICMPCHCDGRKLAGYARGLHKEWEKHWSKKVGTKFEKRNLLQSNRQLSPSQARADGKRVLQMARDVDRKFGLNLSRTSVPDLLRRHDVWLETVNLCRASFAVASVVAPPRKYPYNDRVRRAPFDKVFGNGREELLAEVDRVIMHDAVLNTAIVWKHIWKQVSA